MAGYSPLHISGNKTGLVTNRENFLLPNDAYPKLENAYVWREQIKRKQGCSLLDRLQRNLMLQSLGNTIATGVEFNLFTQINLSGTVTAITQADPGAVTTGSDHLLQTGQYVSFSSVGGMTEVNGDTYQITVTGVDTFTIGIDTTTYTAYTSGGTWKVNDTSLEPYKSLVLGSVVITMPGPIVFTDQRDGTLTSPTAGNSGVINYISGDITLTTTAGAGISVVSFSYYPALPVMGIRIRELQNSLNDQTVFFDQVYAYIYNQTIMSFEEYIPGTTWNLDGEGINGTSFFWTTNYWVSSSTIPGTSPSRPLFTTDNRKLFWESNNTGQFGGMADPPRISDGVTWVDFYHDTIPATFSPWAQIDATTWLVNFLSMLPFRGRMLAFNTWEGTNAGNGVNFSNRIRWSTIGNPFIPYDAGPPAKGSWRDDIRGQGGFLDIPTSEDIVSVGFVRDNLVIYCERSTWQLRYTGRSIAPFQIERVNSEIGGQGAFSAIQFDTSLISIGDKGIVECDSYKAERIDIKIVDFVFQINFTNNGPDRIQGIRDFINRLAFWTIPLAQQYDANVSGAGFNYYPNIRLVYNYENDSWATFTDTYTALGTYQPQDSRTWLTTDIPWIECNFTWIGDQAQGQPEILGGNQQGFIEYLDQQTVNDPSLAITGITGADPLPTVIESPYHNLNSGDVLGISGIPEGTPYADLNNGVYGIALGDNSNANHESFFRLFLYDPTSDEFTKAQVNSDEGVYVGGGVINIRDNFSIVSKKFNFMDEGQSIQLGFFDILMAATEPSNPGAIAVNVYLDYNDVETSNTLPYNNKTPSAPVGIPDTFFNSIIPTTTSSLNTKGGTKFWQRVFCPTRANFLTIEYAFNNAQMNGNECLQDVQIDSQILHLRRAGRLTQI